MKVWVTRDEPPDGPLSVALRSVGLEVVHEPVIEKRICHAGAAGEDIRRLSANDWLVLTSPFAIEAAITVAGESARVPQVAVVAEPSRKAAEANGLRVALVSSGGDGKSLFAELQQRATGCRICYARSSLAKPPAAWPGISLESPILYETAARTFDSEVINRSDVIAVASPSAVRAIGAAAREAAPGTHPTRLRFASIGSTTSSAVRDTGHEPWVEAPSPSFDSLASAIVDQASGPSTG